MTDAEIDALAEARLKQEQDGAGKTSGASAEGAADTEGVASTASAASAGTDADDAFSKDHASRLEAMHKLQDEAARKREAEASVLDPLKNLYNLIPEGLQPAANSAMGVAGYGALRKYGLPEKYQFGTPENLDAEAARKLLREPAAPPAMTDLQRAQAAAQDNLKRAELTHKYYQSLSPSAMPEQRGQGTPGTEVWRSNRPAAGPAVAPAALSNMPTLQTVPLGGEGTAAHAIKFGAAPSEAAKVSSMSEWQKAIPGHTEELGKVKEMMPGVKRLESGILVDTPEAERLQRELETKARQDKAVAEAKSKALAGERLRAEEELRRAQFRASELSAQRAPAIPPTRAQRIQGVTDWMGDFGKNATKGKISGPGMAVNIGAAASPWLAEQAQENWEKDRLKAIAMGLGSLGTAAMATGSPYGIVGGALATLPAAAYGAKALYDRATGLPVTEPER